MSTHLVLGGARSGKSAYAETLSESFARQTNKELIYMATATADDKEMAARIKRHQADRHGKRWQLIEEPLDLAKLLSRAQVNQSILIDCLTLWLSNCLTRLSDEQWQRHRTQFIDAIEQCPADIVMVSNEVGSGIVPMGELSRRFVDQIGWLHQCLAAKCDHVTLVVAGLPCTLK